MSRDLPSVDEVRRLLAVGETLVAPAGFLELGRLALLHLHERFGRAVLAKRIQRIVNGVPNDTEAIAAVFACLPELRTAWMRIVAARLREAGKRRDAVELCQAISTLRDASDRVREIAPKSSLEPTAFGKLETELFGEAAHQAVVSPKLLRVIGATAWLVEGAGVIKGRLPAIAQVDPLVPKLSWCGGRVIQLPSPISKMLAAGPGSVVTPMANASSLSYVLRGDCSPLSDNERVAEDNPWRELMRWVLYRPWCMLLAQVVFIAEAWRAEQISGQMTLELAEDQISNPYEPKRVDVVVTTPDGSEILCGTLGQLVVRVLDRLQVTLLARDEEVERLDERLAGVIRLLLERKVWRFDPRGAGGSRPGYLIDDDFSTSCYRAFGSKYFYRAGSVLTAAIRASAEQWASEKQAKSREYVGVGLPANDTNEREWGNRYE
jgi:hypothetical protein